ncbi:hypothetical protein HYU13_01070 [Candidatus Woesearchaeota archaeon]|nr:hypothetical protein [Candidatus Woesearchaeota archaeon]
MQLLQTFPEGEQFYLERLERKVFCGPCMAEMTPVKGNLFACGNCGKTYWSDRR